MQTLLNRLDAFFTEETSSVSVSLFRIPVAAAVGAQFIPTLLEFQDNYSPWAFRTKNPNYFPPGLLELVERSPEWLVQAVAVVFVLSWFCFLVGLFTQPSCIVMDLCCNYLYCLNFTPHGMLSLDILLVTVFLMAVTPYPGDHFSLDAWRRARRGLLPKRRPIFLLRLLQFQMAVTYFHTGLCKILPGNWWSENPYHYLMNTPAGGIVRDAFFLKDYLAPRPGLCFTIGLSVVLTELFAPVLLYVPWLRPLGIGLALFFQGMLFCSLHVPTTTFLFTFPFQILLFIPVPSPGIVVYDGKCGFCRTSLAWVRALDLFRALREQDLHELERPEDLHPSLSKEACLTRLHYLEHGKSYAGFYAFRRMALRLPTLYVLVPFLFLPGMGFLGPRLYDWISRHRERISGAMR